MDCLSSSTASTSPATAPGARPTSWTDLEPSIYDARSAARVMRFLLDEVLKSQHPLQKSGGGYVSLWLTDDLIDALNFTSSNLLVATVGAAEAFERMAASGK